MVIRLDVAPTEAVSLAVSHYTVIILEHEGQWFECQETFFQTHHRILPRAVVWLRYAAKGYRLKKAAEKRAEARFRNFQFACAATYAYIGTFFGLGHRERYHTVRLQVSAFDFARLAAGGYLLPLAVVPEASPAAQERAALLAVATTQLVAPSVSEAA